MKTELKAKLVSLLLVTIMLCSISTGAVTADVNSANESKNINIINVVKEYREYKDAEKYDFHMAVSELSPSGEYFVVAGPEGVFAFDWKGNLIWEYTFSHIYMRLVHKIHTSPDGEWIVLVRASSEVKKTLYLFDNLGEGVELKKFEGNDLGDLTQPTVDFVADSSKLSVKFPNKILLFEFIKEEAKE